MLTPGGLQNTDPTNKLLMMADISARQKYMN